MVVDGWVWGGGGGWVGKWVWGWWLGGCGGGWVGKGGCGVKQSLSNEIALIETVSANRNAPWRNLTGKILMKFFQFFFVIMFEDQ